MTYKKLWNPLHWGKTEEYVKTKAEIDYSVQNGLFNTSAYEGMTKDNILTSFHKGIVNVYKEREKVRGDLQTKVAHLPRALDHSEKVKLLKLASGHLKTIGSRVKLEDKLKKLVSVFLFLAFISFTFSSSTTGSVVGAFSQTSMLPTFLGIVFLAASFALFQIKCKR